jgi:hypothetical protein
VRIVITGNTSISKTGITSSTFKTVPDAPFSSVEAVLPEGPYSALAANGDLCASKLTMPTQLVGQNGAEINRSTPITVEGCSSALSFTHTTGGRTVTLEVHAPAAGRVTAGGKGLSSQGKTAKGRETLTLRLIQKRAGRLRTTVRVGFTPSAGKDRGKRKQAKTATLTLER